MVSAKTRATLGSRREKCGLEWAACCVARTVFINKYSLLMALYGELGKISMKKTGALTRSRTDLSLSRISLSL